MTSGFSIIDKKRVAEILEKSVATDHLSRKVDLFLISLIILNVIAIASESVSSIRDSYEAELYAFEMISIAVFTVEFVARLWCASEVLDDEGKKLYSSRWSYFLSPMALIDLLAILPYYLSLLIAIDLRILLVVRLLRIFKLSRYSSAMGMLLNVLKEEAQAFMAALFVLVVLLVLASCGIYLIEHEVQPEAFGSIPAAMWWAMATLTTVGYGDVTPITPLGKIFGGFITIIGVGMVALPAGILASGFSNQFHRARQQYDEALGEVLKDGMVSLDEEEDLNELRVELGLSKEEAKQLYDLAMDKLKNSVNYCPKCGHDLSKHNRLFNDED